MTDPTRPLPKFPEPDSEPFWRATKEHRLLFRVDPATGEAVPIPCRGLDPSPELLETQWRESAGTGSIYSFTVVRQHGQPYFRSRVPYVVAFIDLDEGFRMLSEVLAEPDTVRIGQRVRVEWEDHDELSIPCFRPVEAGESAVRS
jgi:uncharacterized OB-fold protein